MLGIVDRTLTDNDIRLLFKYRTDYLLDIRAAVLIVRIGIHDDVSTKVQAGVDTCHKALCKSLVLLEGNDVVETELTRSSCGIVLASVVYYKILYLVNSVYMPRKVIIGEFEGLFLVVAGYLDYQLHIIASFLRSVPRKIFCIFPL